MRLKFSTEPRNDTQIDIMNVNIVVRYLRGAKHGIGSSLDQMYNVQLEFIRPGAQSS